MAGVEVEAGTKVKVEEKAQDRSSGRGRDRDRGLREEGRGPRQKREGNVGRRGRDGGGIGAGEMEWGRRRRPGMESLILNTDTSIKLLPSLISLQSIFFSSS